MKRRKKIIVRARYSRKNDVTLYHGDCLKFLASLPDRCAQLVVTSPPYNVGKAYEKRVPLADYLKVQKKVIKECVRIIRPGGSLCWQVGTYMAGPNNPIHMDLLIHPIVHEHYESDGMTLRNRVVWHFEHGLNSLQRFSGRYETILWYSKGADYVFNLDSVRVPQKYPGKKSYKGCKRGTFSGNPLGKNPGDVWTIPNVKARHIEKTSHPCQFPLELPSRLILALTRRAQLVVDPYMGVGTTAAAAVRLGRRVAGADLIQNYLHIAKQRVMAAAAGTLAHRPLGKAVYVPPPGTPLTTPPLHFRRHA